MTAIKNRIEKKDVEKMPAEDGDETKKFERNETRRNEKKRAEKSKMILQFIEIRSTGVFIRRWDWRICSNTRAHTMATQMRMRCTRVTGRLFSHNILFYFGLSSTVQRVAKSFFQHYIRHPGYTTRWALETYERRGANRNRKGKS